MADKTSLPFDEQYGAGLLLGLYSPFGANAFSQFKPQEFSQLFGSGGSNAPGIFDPNATLFGPLGAQRRFTQDYQPFSFAAGNPAGRPGGLSAAEQAALDTSLFGTSAPFPNDPSNMMSPARAQGNMQNFTSALLPGTGTFYAENIDKTRNALFPGGMPALQGIPTAPTLPAFGAGTGAPSAPSLPGAPSLSPFNFDTASYMKSLYDQMVAGQPGLQGALNSSLDPHIPLPAQSIFDMVKQQEGGGALDKFVNSAVSGTEGAVNAQLQRELAGMQSRFASEGSYMSGPALNAEALMRSDALGQLGGIIGPMELQSANMEQDRIYKAAEAQYGTEYARNLSQVQIQAQQASAMAETFARIAEAGGGAQASAKADEYRTQANYLSSIYSTQAGFLSDTFRTQTSAATSAYNTQAGFLESLYGTQADMYKSGLGFQGQLNSQLLQNAQATADQISKNLGVSFDEAMKIALNQQSTQQNALNNLQTQFDRPGTNMLQTLNPLMKLPTVSKTAGGGAGAIGGGLGSLLGTLGSSGLGSLFGGSAAGSGALSAGELAMLGII